MTKLGLTARTLAGVATVAFVLLNPAAANLAVPAGSAASPFYQFDIVASGGSLGQGPSIDNNGSVAYSSHSPGGLFYWNGTSSGGAVNINPAFTNSNRSFGDSVQLDDGAHILARDQVPGSPPSSFIRIWDALTLNSPNRLARGGNAGDYDSVFSNPSFNNSGQVVFSALRGSETILVTPNPAGGFNESVPIRTPIRQAMDDNGNIVLRTGNTLVAAPGDPISPIELYNYGLDTPTTIADTTSSTPMFSAVGRSPGISDDGTVIAFYGNLTAAGADQLAGGGYITNPGPGIFASIDDGGASRKLVRMTGWQVENVAADKAAGIGNKDGECDQNWVAGTGENCSPAPELGWSEASVAGGAFNAATNPPAAVGFGNYDVNTRVAVTHTDLGAAGILGDTFTVAFSATPTGQSRINPATGQPFLFTNQKGIWTVSTTVAPKVGGSHKPVYHPAGPLRVAQVGDLIGTQTITDLNINDALGQGMRSINGSQTVRPGDHQIAFWASTTGGDMIIRGTHFDSDEDGLLDHWETTGIDINGDSTTDLNLPAMGASPTKRDIFLELDWLAPRNDGVNPFSSYQPAPGVTPLLVAMFAAAPALADGVQQGIVAHIDAGPGKDAASPAAAQQFLSQGMSSGPLQGGSVIGAPPAAPIDVILNSVPGAVAAVPGLNAVAFQTLKDQYFAGGTVSGPAAADLGARELAFHYAIFGAYYDPWMVAGAVYTDTVSAASNNAAGTLAQLTTTNALPNNGAKFTAPTVKVLTGVGAGQIRTVSKYITAGGNNRADYKPAWTTPPAAGDKVAFIIGSSGVAETGFEPSPDFNPHPGNDLMVTLAGFGINAGGWLSDQCVQWRTLAHELGHTLGLRHGGIDHFQYKGGPGGVPAPGAIDNAGTLYAGQPYNSLMSYSWQTDCPSQGSPGGAAVSAVQSYSGAADPVFNDWANVHLDPQSALSHFTSSLWHDGYSGAVTDSVDAENADDTFNIEDYRRQNGGDPDLAPPTATVTQPRDGKQFAVGDSVATSFTAADDVGIDRVTASLDVNGDGVLGAGETVTAVAGAGGTYTATLPPLSGSFGARDLTLTVYDLSGNIGGASRSIGVGAVAENDPPDVSLAPIASVAEASSIQVSASASDPEGDPITYSWSAAGATISGSGSTASLSVGDGPATVTVTVTVTDSHGNATSASRDVVVDNVAPSGTFSAGTANEGSPFTLSVSGVTDPSVADTAAGFSYAFDCGAGYGAFGAGASVLCGTADSGTLSVGTQIRDRDGGMREYRDSVSVKNMPPLVSGGNAQTQFWGLPVTLVGAATDPSPVDQAAGFVSSWSFGDGQSSTGMSAAHAFAKPGSYTPKFSATDKDGATGSATVAVTIGKRGGVLAYVGATSAPYGFLTLQARLSDSVDKASALLAGHAVLFMLGTQSLVATTDATGLASVSSSSIAPGSYAVVAQLPNDAYYNATAGRATVTVTRSLGRVTGTGLAFAAGGSGSLSAISASTGVTGTLAFSSPTLTVNAGTLGPLGIRADGHAAWLNGVDTTGRKLVVYAEDNGPGPSDIYKLWVGGTLVTGTGTLIAGDVVIGP